MPAYWFMYNMYALERNAWKYRDRDKRTSKVQLIEYNYLAPDTVNEIFDGLAFLKKLEIKEDGSAISYGWENSSRDTQILKVSEAINIYTELVQYYCTSQLMIHLKKNKFSNFEDFKKSLTTKLMRSEWLNIGSQLIRKSAIKKLREAIKGGKIKSWDDVHGFYIEEGNKYEQDKLQHAYTSLLEILGITARQFTPELFKNLMQKRVTTRTWMCSGIYEARAKDYSNPFRKMVYETNEEMNKVMGRLEDNSFIQDQIAELDYMKKETKAILKKFVW